MQEQLGFHAGRVCCCLKVTGLGAFPRLGGIPGQSGQMWVDPEAKWGTHRTQKEEGNKMAVFDEFWIGSLYNQKVSQRSHFSTHRIWGWGKRERAIFSGLRDFKTLTLAKEKLLWSVSKGWGGGCPPLPAIFSQPLVLILADRVFGAFWSRSGQTVGEEPG